jgi:hypothetical protein
VTYELLLALRDLLALSLFAIAIGVFAAFACGA